MAVAAIDRTVPLASPSSAPSPTATTRYTATMKAARHTRAMARLSTAGAETTADLPGGATDVVLTPASIRRRRPRVKGADPHGRGGGPTPAMGVCTLAAPRPCA